MKLIVGLGNPGKEYEKTRHNAGFIALQELAKEINANKFKFEKKFNAEICIGEFNDKKIILAKPQTFMNESGLAVQAITNFYKITPENLVVIHDEKDLPIGEYKIQTNRGSAGHNGVKSIIEHLGTKNFVRARIGVAPQTKEIKDTSDFVLGKFGKEEFKILDEVTQKIIEEIVKFV
ncbi:MAG: Peptidyl-tRNA hydrolase [Candidatus Magasanikbacteria bacterium GW2011_GWC2_34_16]|uniref:Peptidyl-tRNA hydrolase n=2 Tax=Candidatus Magasanikiibacteriota TaxID=1752731 RepID=A0A0G0HPE7_9BACT|nr:MAG: Peptidyl-tRNA hydrolase [Candidatus Magasanikbacteria bacterium GW2011_GWC2_34_16]KKQ40475.1 MAG: Peptidyl-tRNA hydrolase [Candidatus Magasanikbacteria bacterium GW2011_GWA2_37_8]